MLPWIAGSRNRRSQDLDEEIGYDFALEVEELVGAGMPRAEAERSARREFGNVLLIQENTREIWGWTRLEQVLQDVRFAMRALRGSPASTMVALLSLALGIGVATASFGVAYGLLSAPYPYSKPDEIWRAPVWNARHPQVGVPLRLKQYLEIRQSGIFADVMAFRGETELLTGRRAAESVHGMLFTANAFQFLGTPPLLGRTILPSDINAAGEAAPVVELSYKLWQRWFGGNPNALGQTLVLNGQPRTVIGVMPQRFGWWAELWLPLSMDSLDRTVTVNMRVNPNVSMAQTERDWRTLIARLFQESPQSPPRGFATRLLNEAGVRVGGGMSVALNWLIVVSAFLLLIACANVTNLQLARATCRAREIAVRLAVGAGRGRIVRQLLTESVALSILGSALALPLSMALIPAAAVLLPDFHELRPDVVQIGVNGYVILFCAALSLLAGFACGVAPAVRCSRLRLAAVLKDAPRTTETGAGGARMRSLFVILEVALSVTLLFAALIPLRGFLKVRNEGAGFQPARALAVDLPLPFKRYVTYEARIALARHVLERVRQLPGVQSVAIGNPAGWLSGLSVEGRSGAGEPPVQVGMVSADYARTLGIPLRAGREFTTDEIYHGAPVGLVNEAAVRRFWPGGQSPIGARVRLDMLQRLDPSFLTPGGGDLSGEIAIVGVVANTNREPDIGVAGGPVVLLPYTLFAPPFRKLAIQTRNSPMQMLNPLRNEIENIDPELRVLNPWSVDQPLSVDIAQSRFEMALFGFVAIMGLALAAAGIYGVLQCSVAQRTHEIGIRMALGATPRTVLGAILMQGGKLILTGLGIGILGSMALVQEVDTAGIPKADALAIAAVTAVLTPIALLACYLPARRALRLDPMTSLRHE